MMEPKHDKVSMVSKEVLHGFEEVLHGFKEVIHGSERSSPLFRRSSPRFRISFPRFRRSSPRFQRSSPQFRRSSPRFRKPWRTMSATCSTTATKVVLNLLKITLQHYAPYQKLATFVTACETDSFKETSASRIGSDSYFIHRPLSMCSGRVI